MSGQKKLPLVHCFTARFARSDRAGRSCSKRGFACEGVLLEAHFRDRNVHRISGLRYLIWSRRRSSPAFPSVAKIQGRVAAPQHRAATLRVRVLQALPLADTFVFVQYHSLFPRQWKKSVVTTRQFAAICRELRRRLKTCVFNCWKSDSPRFPLISYGAHCFQLIGIYCTVCGCQPLSLHILRCRL